MKINIVACIILLSLLPQCARVNKKKIFDPIQKQAEQRINIAPKWRSQPDEFETDRALSSGITITDAVAIGLNNNPTLQAHFEEIGISKSDLIQAGFYTNPYLDTVFRHPLEDAEQAQVKITASVSLSDLWKVPLRKRVAQDSLEVKTNEIVNQVLHLRKDVQLAYLGCYYQLQHLKLVNEIVSVVETLKQRIKYRYQFGYGTKLDTYFVSSKLGEWRAKEVAAQLSVDTAYTALHEILGSTISSEAIPLLDGFSIVELDKSKENLENFALSAHPMILIEKSKMARAKHSISYEASRVFDDVQLGVSYERDWEKGVYGVGPSFGISIPLFNGNSGNIEHARYEYKQAEKMLYAQEQMIAKHITTRYLSYRAYLDQIALYDQLVIPPTIKAIEFSKEFFDRMQMSMIVFFETQIDLFQNKLKLLDLQYHAMQEYVELEFAVGARFRNLDL